LVNWKLQLLEFSTTSNARNYQVKALLQQRPLTTECEVSPPQELRVTKRENSLRPASADATPRPINWCYFSDIEI